MPLADVAWVLEQSHRSCDHRGLGFGAYPMHELAAHPQVAELLGLFADHVGTAEFEPLSTTGVPLAVRQDWQDVLAAAASLGTTTVWVALHGLGVEHDRQVNRPGAYAETCLAIQRVHAAGLRAGCNVFLTTATAGQAERLLGALGRLQVDQMAWEPATWACHWSAARAWSCTPAWPSGTASGTATCAPTVPRPCSAAPWNRAGGPSTQCGSGRTRCRRLASWPPGMAAEQGRECTSPRRRFATCGWTGPSDAPPPSSTRGRGMSERLAWCRAISVDACPSITPRRHHGPPGDPGGQHACGEPCHRWVVSSTGWDSVP
jgi:hypothetical protein